MSITRSEYQIKQLAFSLAERAIRSPCDIDESVAGYALQIFIRVPGLRHEHAQAKKVLMALDTLGGILPNTKEKERARVTAYDAFDSLDNIYDSARTYDHYSDLDPAFIVYEEDNRA